MLLKRVDGGRERGRKDGMCESESEKKEKKSEFQKKKN